MEFVIQYELSFQSWQGYLDVSHQSQAGVIVYALVFKIYILCRVSFFLAQLRVSPEVHN